jgi:predicted RNase H-like HicB family nuclease
MMKKLLAVVRRTEDGFRGYVPKLPGCEVHAATAEQAEADVIAAARAHLAAGKEGTNGMSLDTVEIVPAVEPPPPPPPPADVEDVAAYYWGFEFLSDEELEAMLNPEDHQWFTFEEVMRELGYDEAEPPAGRCAE